jgi:hypothetical protein
MLILRHLPPQGNTERSKIHASSATLVFRQPKNVQLLKSEKVAQQIFQVL